MLILCTESFWLYRLRIEALKLGLPCRIIHSSSPYLASTTSQGLLDTALGAPYPQYA